MATKVPMTDEQKKKLAACAKAKGATLYDIQTQSDLAYVECSDKNPSGSALCEDKGIEAYPTWVLNGKQIRGYMDLETLSKALNCALGYGVHCYRCVSTQSTSHLLGNAASLMRLKSALSHEEARRLEAAGAVSISAMLKLPAKPKPAVPKSFALPDLFIGANAARPATIPNDADTIESIRGGPLLQSSLRSWLKQPAKPKAPPSKRKVEIDALQPEAEARKESKSGEQE